MPKALDTETRYRLLKLLEHNPQLSQRQLAAELGISLGKINYCVRALIDRGWIKAHNFTRSDTKKRYLYTLTPHGVSQKAVLAMRFLRHKRSEYERLVAEIEELRVEVEQQSFDLGIVSQGESNNNRVK